MSGDKEGYFHVAQGIENKKISKNINYSDIL